jgi:hypothetical protein
MAHFGIHFSKQPFCIHIANVLGMISGFFKCTLDIWVTLFGDSWFFYVSRQLAANASVCMSHVQSGLPLWPLVPMLALSLASPLCSPGLFDFLALVGLLGPCWCHLQSYEGISGVHPTEDVGLLLTDNFTKLPMWSPLAPHVQAGSGEPTGADTDTGDRLWTGTRVKVSAWHCSRSLLPLARERGFPEDLPCISWPSCWPLWGPGSEIKEKGNIAQVLSSGPV